jgi:hypothetical protein
MTTSRRAATFGIAVALSAGLFISAAEAQPGRCSWPPPEIKVMRLTGPEPAIDASLSKDEVAARRAARGASASRELGFGYYEASAEIIYNAELQSHRLDSGNVCLAIKTLDVEFGIRTRRILIARELSLHPCLLDYVTRHERKHPTTDDELVVHFLPRLQAALEAAWHGGLGVEARDEADGLAALKGMIDARLTELRTGFVGERNIAQDKLDDQDFARDALPPACRDEFARLLGSRP